MRDETLRRLRASDRSFRIGGWSNLAEEIESGKALSLQQAKELHQALEEEDDDGVFRFATTVLFGHVLLQLAAGDQVDKSQLAKGDQGDKSQLTKGDQGDKLTVDEWFSHLFMRRSALFSTKEMDFQHRDASALAHLARRFPKYVFENTCLHPVPLDDDQLGTLRQSQHYETILIVGRPCMFGKLALDIQRIAGADLHFRFPSKQRPENLKPGEINPRYHYIEERFADGSSMKYQTQIEGDTRTDYGLVQVYPKFRNRVTFVDCGGCSSLGTLGTSRWLAYDLREERIPVPPGISSDTTMEALVKTTAKDCSPCGLEDPSDIELIKLYFDKYAWDFKKKEWEFAERPVILLTIENDCPVALIFDGEEKKFQQGSESFLLIANLLLAADKSPDQTVKVETLARNQRIWNKQGGVETSYAKKRLQNINAGQLHGVLSFTHDKVQLNADVEIKNT